MRGNRRAGKVKMVGATAAFDGSTTHESVSGDDANRWRRRPVLAGLLVVIAHLVPIAASAGAAAALSRNLAKPQGIVHTGLTLSVLLAVSAVVLVVVDRVAHRLLPLATLLKLSMLFPDRAPKRLAVARRAGSIRNLESRLERARTFGLDDEPVQAAETILTLVAALHAHDRHTRGHSERVRMFVDLLADEMRLPTAERDRLRWASLLHDIGKLEVAPGILNKPGRLNDEEWRAIHRHPEDGARLARPLHGWLGTWGPTIEQHHERWDGGGYPRGLRGEEICLGARIVGVADGYEVMTAVRPYKKAMSVPAAREELTRCAGTQFDPSVVRAFLSVSIGRIRWGVGVVSWLAQLPFVGWLPRLAQGAAAAGGQAAALAGTAVGVAALTTTGVVIGVLPSAPSAPAAPHEAAAASGHGAGTSGGAEQAAGFSGSGPGFFSLRPGALAAPETDPTAAPLTGTGVLPSSGPSAPGGRRPAGEVLAAPSPAPTPAPDPAVPQPGAPSLAAPTAPSPPTPDTTTPPVTTPPGPAAPTAPPAPGAPPSLVSLEMFDLDLNGVVDRVLATFSQPLASQYSAGTAPWSLTDVPSGGTLESVEISGSQAILNLRPGSGKPTTALGAFAVALSEHRGGVRDATGQMAAFSPRPPLDRAGPVPVDVATTAAGSTPGRAEAGDILSVTFSEPVSADSVPSLTLVSEEDVPGSAADTLTVGGVTASAIDTGSRDYVTRNGRTASFLRSVTGLRDGGRILDVQLGPLCVSCSVTGAGAGALVFRPAASLTDASGNPAGGMFATASGFRLF